MARSPAVPGSGTTRDKNARAFQRAQRSVADDHRDEFEAAREFHKRIEGLRPATYDELASILEREAEHLRRKASGGAAP